MTDAEIEDLVRQMLAPDVTIKQAGEILVEHAGVTTEQAFAALVFLAGHAPRDEPLDPTWWVVIIDLLREDPDRFCSVVLVQNLTSPGGDA